MFKKCTALFVSCFVGLSAPIKAELTTDSPRTPIQHMLGSSLEQQCDNLPSLRQAPINDLLWAFYSANDFLPVWKDINKLSSLREELLELAHDGLNPFEYLDALSHDTDDAVCADLRPTSVYLLALEHLSRGRLSQQQQEPMWSPPTQTPPVRLSIIQLAELGLDEISMAFSAARPRLPLYLDLRTAYRDMERDAVTPTVFPAGPSIKPGSQDHRVPLLAERLTQEGFLPTVLADARCLLESLPDGLPGASLTDPLAYHQDLELAVRGFQNAYGLQADGIVGRQTIAALNVTPAERQLQVRINLERLRWLAARRHDRLLLVNAAGSTARLYHGNTSIWASRVQTGSAHRATPLLDSRINRVTLNPSWTIPPTILRKDKLPAIRRNPDYFAQHDLLVLDYQGNRIDPNTVDWNNPSGLMLRQPPGPQNPLGRMAFRFDNPFSVYLHDTPSQALFARAARNVSSGCVRVEQAKDLAEVLFSTLDEQQQVRIEHLQATGETHEIRVQDGPQVILGYWTAQATEDGQLTFTADPYEMDVELGRAFAAATRSPVAHPLLSCLDPSVPTECNQQAAKDH